MSITWRPAAALLLCLAVVSGCTSGGSGDTAGEPSGAAPSATAAPTPWSDALDAFDPEGTPDVAAALTLFSLAFGPIEGAPEPPAESGASGDITVAYRAVLGVWDQLSQAQRDAVQAALVPPADSSATGEIGLLAGARAAAKPDPALLASYTSMAVELRAKIAAKIGDYKGKLTVVVATRDNAATDLGYATPSTVGPDGTFSSDCIITMLPIATSKGADVVINTMAHEIFHCFQVAALGTAARYATAPKWVIEGGAEWVAAMVAGPDSTLPGRWAIYLNTIKLPLQKRSYPAVGFWSHLDESGTSPWGVFRTVWEAAGTPAAFAASGANSPAFLESWASGWARQPDRGPAWDTTGPGITADAAQPEAISVPPGGSGSGAAAAYANALYVVNSDADVLVFSATGTARISDGTIDTTQVEGSRFCLRDGGCTCPDVPDDIPPPPLLTAPLVALTGGPTGSSMTVNGLTLDQHCKDKKKGPVQVTVDRPASTGVLAGQVVELTSCTGAYGDWSGVFRLGGLSLDGFEVPFQELPVAFTVGGSGTRTVPTAVSGVVSTPVFDLNVAYDLSITVDGSTMSITGTGSADNGMLSVDQIAPGQLSNLPIEPAPDGACP